MAITEFSLSGRNNTKSDSMLIGNSSVAPAYDFIAKQNGTGSSGIIEFWNIPSNYTHLQIRGIGRSDYATGNYVSTSFQFNGAGGTEYSSRYLVGNGASASAYDWAPTSQIYGTFNTAVNAIALNYAAYIIDIFDYTNTNKYKTIRCLNGFDNNALGSTSFNQGTVGISSGLWKSTSAITSMKIINSGNWTTDTNFALYGIG
ncbi:hypothetical protein EB001_20875 [bacterium]|nr:hypothetical protein [bacterium]